MGLFSQRLAYEVEGHSVEVEAVDTGFANRFSLIVDNRRVDEQSGFLGGITLRGLLGASGQPIVVKVTSGVLVTPYVPWPLGTSYSLRVEQRRRDSVLCSHCGTQLPTGAAFCHSCGASVMISPGNASRPNDV